MAGTCSDPLEDAAEVLEPDGDLRRDGFPGIDPPFVAVESPGQFINLRFETYYNSQ